MQAAGFTLLSDLLGWLFPLMHLGCAVVCLSYLRVSKSLLIAAAGFGLLGFVGIGWRLFLQFQRMGQLGAEFQRLIPLVSALQMFAALIGLAGVSLGLFLALSEAYRKLSSPGDTPWIT